MADFWLGVLAGVVIAQAAIGLHISRRLARIEKFCRSAADTLGLNPPRPVKHHNVALSALILYGTLNGLDLTTTRMAQANGAVEVGLLKRHQPQGFHLLISGAGTVVQTKIDARLHGKKKWLFRSATIALYGFAITKNVQNSRTLTSGVH